MYEQMRKQLNSLKQKAQKEMSNCQQLKNRKRTWIAYERPLTNYNPLNRIQRTSPQQQNMPQPIRESNENILTRIKGISKDININKDELLQKEIAQIKLQNSNLKQRISQLLDDLSKQEQKQNIIAQQYEAYKAEVEQKLKYFEQEQIKGKSNKKELQNLVSLLKEALRQMQKRLNQQTMTNCNLREQIQNCQKKFKPFQNENIKLTEIVNSKLKLIQNLNIEIEELEEKYENQNKQVSNIKQQMQKLRKNVEDCLNEKQNIQSEKKNRQKEFQDKLLEKQTILQCMAKETQLQRQVNQMNLQQKSNQIQHLKRQLREKIQNLKQNDHYKQKYIDLLGLSKEKDATIETLNDNVRLLKVQILQQTDVLRKQQNYLKDLTFEIEAARLQKKTLQQNLQRQLDYKYEQQNIELKNIIKYQEIQLNQIKNNLEQMKVKIEAICKQIDKLKDENQKLKKDNNEGVIEREKISNDKRQRERYFETLINEKDIFINCLQQQKEKYKFQIEFKEDNIKQLNNQIEAKEKQIKSQDQQRQKQANLLNVVIQKDIVIDSLNQNIYSQQIIIQEQIQYNKTLKQEIQNLKLSLMQKQNLINQLNLFIESIKAYQQQNILLKQEIVLLKASQCNKDRQIQQLKINVNDKLIALNQKDEQRQKLYELYHLLSIKQELDYQISSPIMDKVYSPEKRKIASISPLKQKINQNSYFQNSIPITSNLCISLNYTYQILKKSYLIMQAKHLLLSTDLSSKRQQNQILNNQIEDHEIEITNLQNKIKIYQDQVNHMTFRINQLQGIIPEQSKEEEDMDIQEDKIQNFRKAIDKITNNQLNNEDEENKINDIQSLPKQQKQINYFQLTPTDLTRRFKRYQETEQHNLNLQQIQSIKLGSSPERQPFIKIKESNSSSNPSNSNQNLNGDKNKQQDNNYIYEEDQGKQPEAKKIGTKCSLQFINQKIELEQFQDKQKSQELIVPIQRKNEEMIQKQQNKSSLSLQNNPDTEITFTYQQLKEKYRLLIIEYQKMSEYLCRIHNINYNWKKNSHDIEQLSKVNVLSKLSQRLTFLITHKQKAGLHQSQQFIGQLNKLILDLQSYIHFLDHLIKIQPFQDYKYPYPFKKINKKINDNVKFQKEIILRKTRSEGGSYNDELVQNFDIYPFESDEVPRNQQKQMVTTGKQKEVQKQIAEFQKYCEQNKQFLSEISSVKNQSQISQFINSKSQLGHLLNANKPSEQIQVNSRFTLNKNDFYDSDKLSHLPFKEVVYLYYQIKQNMFNLINQKNNMEKQLKKQIQQKQYDCKKKINQITKEFNQSFGLLCLRSGKQLNTTTRDKFTNNNNQGLEKGSQKIIPRKILHSKTLRDNEVKYKNQASGNEELYTDQLIQKQQIIRQLTSQTSKNLEKIKELQKTVALLNEKNEHLLCVIQLKDRQTDLERVIVQENLTQFINKLVSKIHFGEKIIPSLILHKNNIFRKNSSSLYHNQVLLATKITELPMKVQQVLDTIAFYLKNQQLRSQKKDLSKKQLEQILAKSISSLQRSFYQQILILIKRKLQLLANMEADQWSMQLEGIRLALKEELNNNEVIDQIYIQLNLFIKKLRVQNENSVENISIYSKQDERQQHLKKENEFENNTKYMESKIENNNYIMQVDRLKTQCEEITLKYSHLSEQLMLKQEIVNQKTNEIHNCNELIKQLRDSSPWQELIKAKQTEIQFMQEETLALRGQISKMKHKANKKSKIFYVQH